MTSRVLALVLALIIGSPVCWCCAKSAPQAEKPKHSCCQRAAAEEGQPAAPAKKDPCPCGSSMIKREMARTIVDIPPPPVALNALLAPVARVEVSDLRLAATREACFYNDTGPPQKGRFPIYLQQRVLRI